MKISLNNEKYETDALQKETVKFKDLSLKGKASYIWDYYKWWFFAAAIVFTLLYVSIPSIIENNKECVLYTVFLNTNIKGQEYTSIMDDYTDAAEIDMEKKRITLDCSIYIDRKNTTSANIDNIEEIENAASANMQSSQKLTALFSAKTIDVIVSDSANFEFCSSQGAYRDLRELLPNEICEKYSDLFVEAENPETGEMTAYGLNLKDSAVLNEENAFDFEPIISVCLTTEKTDNAVEFIKYLLGEI